MAAAEAVAAAVAVRRRVALPWQPWSVLLPLLLVQWGAVAVFALTVRHNGWLYYQGGDQAGYYTSAWALGEGNLPQTFLGWGWPALLSPIAAAAGPSFLHALPAILLLQGLLLLPLGLASVYSIASRLGGRGLGYAAAGAWIGAPFLAILAADPRYHERWVEQFLPQALGLTGLADFPSMVLLLASAALLLRALDTRRAADTVLTGLVLGLAIGVKPANALFLVGVVLALAWARRIGQGLLLALAMAPALLVLAVWKQRGLGELPLFALGGHVLAAGQGLSLPQPPPLAAALGMRYVDIDWSRLDANLVALREFFWSSRVYHVLPFIGLVAVLRRSRPAGLLLGGWFFAYFLVKGSSQYATVESGAFFRLLLPGLPAYVLLACAIPLLVPGAGSRLVASGRRLAAVRRPLPRPRLVVGAAAVGLALAPLVLIAAAPGLPAGAALKYFQNSTYVAQSLDAPRASVQDGTVRLEWQRAPHTGVGVWYRVLRSDSEPTHCQNPSGGVVDCQVDVDVQALSTVRETVAVDAPGRGTWWYAIGVVANWRDDPALGDVLLLSRPVRVDVR